MLLQFLDWEIIHLTEEACLENLHSDEKKQWSEWTNHHGINHKSSWMFWMHRSSMTIPPHAKIPVNQDWEALAGGQVPGVFDETTVASTQDFSEVPNSEPLPIYSDICSRDGRISHENAAKRYQLSWLNLSPRSATLSDP